MIKCIIFDVYGTLISTGNGSLNATQEILKGKHISVSAEEFYSHWKKLHKQNMLSDKYICEKDIFELDLKMLYERFNIDSDYKADVIPMLNSLYNRKAFDDTATTIEKLSECYDIVIGSNTDSEPLLQNLNYNNLSIEKIFTSENLRCYKPSLKFYKQILLRTGYNADEALFVGDSLNEDVLAPQQSGMKACWINRKRIKNDTTIIPDYHIETLFELPKIMTDID